MEISALIVVVFFLGCSVGGLLALLQRETVIERVRAEFEERLATTLSTTEDEKNRSFADLDTADIANKSDCSSEHEDSYGEWSPLPAATGGVHTHVPF